MKRIKKTARPKTTFEDILNKLVQQNATQDEGAAKQEERAAQQAEQTNKYLESINIKIRKLTSM